MVGLEEYAVRWMIEEVRGFVCIGLLQILVVGITKFLGQSILPEAVCLLLYTIVQITAMRISYMFFDQQTHVLGSLICGLTFLFTGFWQGLSHIHKNHRARRVGISKKEVNDVSFMQLLHRMSYPHRSYAGARSTGETRSALLLKGLILYSILGCFTERLCVLLEYGGLIGDVSNVVVLFIILNALFSLSAGLLINGTGAPFDMPFLARSQAAFWAGRWNAPVSDALRVGVMEPLLHIGAPQNVAYGACFVASGIMHEVLLVFAGRPFGASRGRWVLFFVACGVSAALEKMAVRKAKEYGKPIPKVVVHGWGLFAVFGMYVLWFAPQLTESNLLSAVVKTFAWIRMVPIEVIQRLSAR